jgi:hypothetical protein
MAALLISGSAALTGCTDYSGAYAPAGYAGGYDYGYGAEPGAAYVPPPPYSYGGTAYIGGPVYGDGGYRWRDHDDWFAARLVGLFLLWNTQPGTSGGDQSKANSAPQPAPPKHHHPQPARPKHHHPQPAPLKHHHSPRQTYRH